MVSNTTTTTTTTTITLRPTSDGLRVARAASLTGHGVLEVFPCTSSPEGRHSNTRPERVDQIWFSDLSMSAHRVSQYSIQTTAKPCLDRHLVPLNA